MSQPAITTLIDSARAPNPRRVKIFMAEKGVAFPVEDVSIMEGQHKTKDYRARVGAPVVPAFVLEDGSTLTETMAMCRYLEALYPDPNLMGEGALEIAQIDMWSRRIEFGLLMPIAMVLRHANPAMAVLENQVPEWGEANKPRVSAALKWLDKHLGESEFMAGARYSVADITALVAIDFMRAIKMPIPEDHGNLLRWREALNARASTGVK